MHKQTYQDLSNSNSSMSIELNSSISNQLINKKRSRKKSSTNFSHKEEERIFKYALKLSEKEYLQKQKEDENEKIAAKCKKYKDLPECKVFKATFEDFKNPIAFIDKIWQKQSTEDTGLIKIIPPQEWKEKQRKYFENEITTRINAYDKPLTTRKQTLGLLYEAKVGCLFKHFLCRFKFYFFA